MIWLAGDQGMLGRELAEVLRSRGIEFEGTDKELDITDEREVTRFITGRNFSWVINCAAYTAVDKAEDDEQTATAVNAYGARNLARAAVLLDAPLLHISTDYVFPGTSPEPYGETDTPDPINTYGRGKLLGEQLIQSVTPRHIIIRTAWSYGNKGPSFVHTMLKLMNTRKEINVVNDQVGSPTYVLDLAQVISLCVENNLDQYGLYHFSNEGKTSWYEFAVNIFKLAREENMVHNECTITPIPTAAYPTRAKRPAFSLLSKKKIRDTLGIEIPSWDVSLKRFFRKDYKRWNAS